MGPPMATLAPPTRSPRPTALAAAGALVLAALALSACSVARTALGPLQYDKSSPAAPAIASTSVKGQGYPSFLDVPSQPTDVRPVSAWNRNIFDTLAARRQIDAFQVTYPQTLYGAEAFAQQARAEAVPPLSPDQVKAQNDQTAAFAKDAQARATPPSAAH